VAAQVVGVLVFRALAMVPLVVAEEGEAVLASPAPAEVEVADRVWDLVCRPKVAHPMVLYHRMMATGTGQFESSDLTAGQNVIMTLGTIMEVVIHMHMIGIGTGLAKTSADLAVLYFLESK
jgi:hypothetical protein